MKTIITHSGENIFVDDEDFIKFSKYKWNVSKTNKNNKYAMRNTIINGKRTKVYLHREIMGFPDGLIDHKDQNGLNCQKTNLRIATKSQNAFNSGSRGKIKYKGVSEHKGKYRVQIIVNGKKMTAVEETPELAALHYNRLATKFVGEFAKLNVL